MFNIPINNIYIIYLYIYNMPTKSAPLGALLTFINTINFHNRDYSFKFAPFTNSNFIMGLHFELKQAIKILRYTEDYCVGSMHNAEPFLSDIPEDSFPEASADYNSLGFILASIRDILKEFDKDGK